MEIRLIKKTGVPRAEIEAHQQIQKKLALYVFRAVEHCRSGGWISDRILGRYALRM